MGFAPLPRNLLRASLLLLINLFVPFAVHAQSGMSKAELTKLYTAAGFPIVNDHPVDACGTPAKPRVSFVDVNGDWRPEALFIDSNARCYGPAGRYFAVMTRESQGWRSVAHGAGTIQAQATQTAGWLDMRIAEGNCSRLHRYNGATYAPDVDCVGRSLAQATNPVAPPATSSATLPSINRLPIAKETAAFESAGFSRRGAEWRSACDDPGTASYTPGKIDNVIDLNGDGLPEAVITEGGTYCYGNTGQGYWLVSEQSNGSWKLVTNGTGIPDFLSVRGAANWPDISVGGPGFCFPVERWNGASYTLNRWEYEGKPCTPPR